MIDLISPDLKSAGLRPARAGGKEGQPGGVTPVTPVTPGNPPSRPGRLNLGVGMARRGWPGGGPPTSVRGGDTAPLGLKHQHQHQHLHQLHLISILPGGRGN